MKKKKLPFTTSGRLNYQAKGIIEKIEELLKNNQIDSQNYVLRISQDIIRGLCDLTITTTSGKSYHTVGSIDIMNPFDKEHYWNHTEAIIKKHFGFKSCKKVSNIRAYDFSFK